MKRFIPKDFDDWLLLMTGALLIGAVAVSVLFAMGYLHKDGAVEAEPKTTECSPADYEGIPYADEYEFVCVGDTMEVWDAKTGEYITSEQRCTEGEVRAEDGSCVNENFYDNGYDTVSLNEFYDYKGRCLPSDPCDEYGPYEATEASAVHNEFKEETK